MKQTSISNINRVIGMLYSLSFCVTNDDVRTVLGFAIEYLENTLSQTMEAWNRRAVANTWVSTRTRLPVEEWKQHKESTGEKTTEFIVMIKGAEHPTALYFDGTRWLDESGYNYPVQYWMNMPEIPMEEDNYES